MLLSTFRLEKNKKLGGKFQCCYFADIKHNGLEVTLLGPLMIRYRDFFYTKTMGNYELQGKLNELEKALIDKKDISIKPVNEIISVIHLQGDLSSKLKSNNINGVWKLGDTEYIRLVTDPLHEDYYGFDEELYLQRRANDLLRDLHDGINNDIEEELSSIQTTLGKKIKKHDSKNKVLIDDKRLLILLNSSRGLKRKRKDHLTPEVINNLIHNGSLALTDIEVAKYETDTPEIYLDTLVWQEDSKFKAFISGLPIGSRIFNSDIGKIPYQEAESQDELRKIISKERRDRNFLFISGHNSIGYDERTCLQPNRDKHKGRVISGDGIFRITPDNLETKYYADSKGREIFEAMGLWYIDTNLICIKYFSELFTDSSLETMMSFFGEFGENFNYRFKKGLTYQEINEIWAEWVKGDFEAGEKLVEYCFNDTKFPFHLNEKLIGPIVNISKAIGVDPFRAGYLPDSTLAKLFWDREYFERTNCIRYTPMKNDDKYSSDDNFRNLLSNTNVYGDYDIKKQKKKILEHVLGDINYKTDIEKNCDVFFCPVFAEGVDFVLEHNSRILELYTASRKEESLISLMYSKVIENLAVPLLVDSKAVAVGDLHSFIFKDRYGLEVEEFVDKFGKSLEHMIEPINSENIVSFTGDFIYLKNVDDEQIEEIKRYGYLYFGKADVFTLKNGQVMNFNGLISSSGIKIPSERLMSKVDPGDKGFFYVENHIIYDFVRQLLTNKKKAIESLVVNCNKLANNEFPAMWYIRKLSLSKDAEYYSNQEKDNIRIMKAFGKIKKGDTMRIAVGSYGTVRDNFIYYDESCKDEFSKEFVPKSDYYQKQIFRKGGKLDKLIRAAFIDDKRKEELWEGIKRGQYSIENVDYLFNEFIYSKPNQRGNGQILLFQA